MLYEPKFHIYVKKKYNTHFALSCWSSDYSVMRDLLDLFLYHGDMDVSVRKLNGEEVWQGDYDDYINNKKKIQVLLSLS